MRKIVLSYIDVPEKLYESFARMAVWRQVGKNEVIFRPGKTNNKLLFLEEGLMRAFRLTGGTEYTHHFFVKNWFATDYQSYLTGQPSALYMESLTEVSYYEFDKKNVLDFFTMHPSFEKLGRIIAEQAYLMMVERLVDFQTHNLKDRYLRLINEYPQLFQQVPQKYIASYLGVAEQSLSRIKSMR